MPRRSPVPLVLAVLTAVVSSGALALSVARGWLGPDVGRGDGFCEAARDALVKQPANTFSNVGFVVAGLAVAWRAGEPGTTIRARPRLATAYALVVVLLGPASAAMHATQSAAGGRLDLLSMFLVAGFAAAYAITRLLHRGAGTCLVLWVTAVLACELVEQVPGRVPLLMTWSNAAFAVLLVVAVAGELALWRRGDSIVDRRWGTAAVGSLLVAFAIWSQSKTGSPLCRPDSLLQGHAVWHLLDAFAAYALFRLYASERPHQAPVGSGPPVRTQARPQDRTSRRENRQ